MFLLRMTNSCEIDASSAACASFIRWHNENCPLDDVWEMAPDEGTWDDVDWPTYEHEIKDEIIDYFYDLSASQSAA